MTLDSAAWEDRIQTIDLVRGLALGGMLVANLGVMSGSNAVPLSARAGLGWLAGFLNLLLVEGKFFPLFALLFGWGIARRQQFAVKMDRPFFWVNLRRMAVLGLFGILHAAFFWEGDILVPYALAGAFLPLARRMPVRALWPAAAVLLLLSSFLALPGPGQAVGNAYAAWVSPTAAPLRAGMASTSGGLAPVRTRLAEYTLKLLYLPTWSGNILGMILAGYITGRLGRLPVPERPGGIFPLLAALLLNSLYALTQAMPALFPPDWAPFLRSISLSLGGPLLGLCYAWGIASAWGENNNPSVRKGDGAPSRRAEGMSPSGLFARLGRMPLTTYLSQSALGALALWLRLPWQAHPALLVPLAGLIIAAQLSFSWVWLSYHPRGPFEAAWRRLSAT